MKNVKVEGAEFVPCFFSLECSLLSPDTVHSLESDGSMAHEHPHAYPLSPHYLFGTRRHIDSLLHTSIGLICTASSALSTQGQPIKSTHKGVEYGCYVKGPAASTVSMSHYGNWFVPSSTSSISAMAH
ncbi:hypothetical protein XELAEV_18009008mg [Xenopus laevis]|uniref:Uncharacterized protein n=1 Tax=Xenopus laevis TaxID=8355 RepID=A0A974DRT3_XENLA|nr:hypothetical protein XELAEV_18009008mg [Xenopus laevis]